MTAALLQEIARLQTENDTLKLHAQLVIAIIVHACPGHEITVSEAAMLQNYELKQELQHDSRAITFKARKV